jgi:hypothetical protein
MFFNGIIATGNKNNIDYVLRTETMPEINFNDKVLYGEEIITLAKNNTLNDNSIEDEVLVDIHVDGWIVISEANSDECIDDQNFDNYDEAIEEFINFLIK